MEEEDERSISNFQRSTLKSWLPFLVGRICGLRG